MNYLGLDFGTSNCVACAPDDTGAITFVPLEGDSTLLPTVLFVNRAIIAGVEIDERELDKRVKDALEENRRNQTRILAAFEEELLTFDDRYKPKTPGRSKKPNSQDYLGRKDLYEEATKEFEQAEKKYLQDFEHYQKALIDFVAERKNYESERKKEMGRLSSEDTVRKSVRVAMQREMLEELNKQYLEQTFFDALNQNSDFLFGLNAINAYAEDPLGGFYLRSPKSFLGADIGKDHQEFFINIISKIISHIKKQAEIFFKKSFDGVVLGRPVNYHGTRGDIGNQQALSLMRQAAKRAQFKDIKFFLEPVSATLTIKENDSHTDNTLIVDIGGGTTDCSFLKYQAKSNEYQVVSNSGSRIGGTDFDETLAWNAFMTHFGKDSLDIHNLPIPSSIIRDSIATRDLQAQLRFSKSGYELNKLLKIAAEPFKIHRLITLQENQYQHKLLIEAERLKIGLTTLSVFKNDLSFVENDLSIQTQDSEFSVKLRNPIDSVLKIVQEAVDKVGELPETIYLTGGMSRSKQLILELQKNAVFSVPVRQLDSLSAVSQGLGIVAGALTANSTNSANSANSASVARYLELGLAD